MKIKNPSVPINLALLIISTVFAFLLSEIGLRLMGWSPMVVSPERDRFWKYDSLLGWSHQPGQEGIFETSQFRTSVSINQKGLRDREHSYERPQDTSRILVLGDSFAWGYGVEETQRFSELLETSMDIEVINAGVSGYSTDQELLWLKGEGIKYDTDLVILVFTGNDIGDNDRQLVNTIYYKPQFVREEAHLTLTGYPVPRTSPQGKLIYFLSQRSALAYFLVQRYFDLQSIYSNFRVNSVDASSSVSGIKSSGGPSGLRSSSDTFGLTIALLDEMRNVARLEDAEFMIVATDAWWNSSTGETYGEFMETLRAEGFLLLDVESMPDFDPEGMHIPDDGHWSAAGHEFVAKKIKDFIESNQLLGTGLRDLDGLADSHLETGGWDACLDIAEQTKQH